MKKKHIPIGLTILLLFTNVIFAQNYPDQFYVLRIDSLFQSVETIVNMKLSNDGKSIVLKENVTDGYIVLKPRHSEFPFNEGLPSWNGSAPNNYSSFKVQMRFPYNGVWSPWLTVGFWKANIWSSYGSTSYAGGYVDYDNIKLSSYQTSWQFKIIMTRTSPQQPSSTIYKLSFYVSDSRTTSSVNINQLVNDKPAQIFIPTNFIYQYGVDPQIGESICSPTSVAMILRSYNISVDPLQFAQTTLDPYYQIFGIWPRVVQNAAEYGLDGAVTRYRTWSEAREVLANGGRVSMSVSLPLYSGHLMMLAGFTSDGKPIVHDPARSNGYAYIYNKADISASWFNKGGVAYTFYRADSVTAIVDNQKETTELADDFLLYQNFPNPFNTSTEIKYRIDNPQQVTIKIYDVLGNEVETLIDEEKPIGTYSLMWNAVNLPSGIYLCKLQTEKNSEFRKMILLK